MSYADGNDNTFGHGSGNLTIAGNEIGKIHGLDHHGY